mmetsp:Transcript_36055/g.83675  ORF Transcript_36055/g.83675 Transcript_36055/m.83675 type:complete len:224 (-) Transcript_36055:105-776(-)
MIISKLGPHIPDLVYTTFSSAPAKYYVVTAPSQAVVNGWPRGLSETLALQAMAEQGRWQCDSPTCAGCAVASTEWLESDELYAERSHQQTDPPLTHADADADVTRAWPPGLTEGNRANHPPPGVLPNVAFYEHAFEDLECHLWQHVPNIPGGNPDINALLSCRRVPALDRRVPCVGLIALRDIAEGEEVFVDYGYDPAEAPGWFTPVQYPTPTPRAELKDVYS